MPTPDHADYYRRRAEAARAMAERAAGPEIARIHNDLAASYAARAEAALTARHQTEAS